MCNFNSCIPITSTNHTLFRAASLCWTSCNLVSSLSSSSLSKYTYDVLVEDILTFNVPGSKLVEWKTKASVHNDWRINKFEKYIKHILLGWDACANGGGSWSLLGWGAVGGGEGTSSLLGWGAGGGGRGTCSLLGWGAGGGGGGACSLLCWGWGAVGGGGGNGKPVQFWKMNQIVENLTTAIYI